MMNMNRFYKQLFQGMGISSYLFVSCVNAAPGGLSNTPLVVSNSIDPNIMLLVDSSGSMNNVVPDSPYDANTAYVKCLGTGLELSNGSQVDVRVQSDGDVYFQQSSTDYDWGITGGSGQTGHSKRCFDSALTYQAKLYADTGSNPKSPSGYLPASYSGNYLNWYFSNNTQTASDNFGSGNGLKPVAKTRAQITKAAAALMVNNVTNANIGLSQFDGNDGALILEGMKPVSSNKAALLTEIGNLRANGPTPIAEALEALGRYFVTGHESEQLTLTPRNAASSTQSASSVFSHTPEYKDINDVPNSTNKELIKYWCQKSSIVLMTDGQNKDDTKVDSDLQDYDGDCVGASPACTRDMKGAPYSYEDPSTSSDYMDDVALALNDIDLRPNLNGLGTNVSHDNQTVQTHAIGFADDQVINDPLMKDTAVNGGGLLLTATNTSELLTSLIRATNEIFAQNAAVGSVAFNSSTLDTDTAIYFAEFQTETWEGNLYSFALNPNTGSIAPSYTWEASEELDKVSVTANTRTIITHNGTDGIPFRWTASGVNSADPGPMVRQDLEINAGDGSDDNGGSDRLDYLRGDSTNEVSKGNGGSFRDRNSRLGDIVNSTPVYVGEPQSNWPDHTVNPDFGTSTKPYSAYAAGSAMSRTPVLYVGANDGMFHGFNASTSGSGAGSELIAYVPQAIASTAQKEGLHYLTHSSYQHRFHVDLSPVASDVFINSDPALLDSDINRDWHTVVMGGLRAGGKGYFLLDATDPSQFSEANAASLVLWEFTDTDAALDGDDDLGYTYSVPTIAMMNNGKWAAIFGNGYDSANGTAQLFIVFIEEGKDGWAVGEWIELDTQVGSAINKNGLSTPAVADMDGNGTADRVYAGDLFGNMWAFDVSNTNDTKWKSAYDSGGGSAVPEPLFVAKDASSNVQPITAKPLLGRNPDSVSGNAPNIVVMFGTGQYVNSSDISDTKGQSYYVVADVGDEFRTRSDLVARTFTETGLLREGEVNGTPIDWTTRYGWYMDLNAGSITASLSVGGERVVSQSLLRRRTLFFNSIIPDTSPCGFGGSGWLMSLDYLTGLATTQAVFDANNDGTIDSSDLNFIGKKITGGIPAKSGILGKYRYTPDSSGGLTQDEIDPGSSALEGRLGWEELTPQ
jgi:type IV pilus assembly protein PilY1